LPSTQPTIPNFPSIHANTSTAPSQSLYRVANQPHAYHGLCQSCTSGNVLQTTLCYLKAICAKVPKLVNRYKMGDRVQGEPDLSGKIVQDDLEAEEWGSCPWMPLWTLIQYTMRCLVIHVSTFNIKPRFYLKQPEIPLGAKSCQETQAPCRSFTPVSTLPSPLLCPCHTFLTSLILASKFKQDQCYLNKAMMCIDGIDFWRTYSNSCVKIFSILGI